MCHSINYSKIIRYSFGQQLEDDISDKIVNADDISSAYGMRIAFMNIKLQDAEGQI